MGFDRKYLTLYRTNLLCLLVLSILLCSTLKKADAEGNPIKFEELPPALAALTEGLLSNNTEESVRLKQAMTLLLDPKSHAILRDILLSMNHDDARIILCQAIARTSRNAMAIPPPKDSLNLFIDPLYGILDTENKTLAFWAANTLAAYQNQAVTLRLTLLVADSTAPQVARLAGIAALSHIPGKPAIVTLGNCLESEDEKIRLQSDQAIRTLLNLDDSVPSDTIKNRYIQPITTMDEKEFLFLQLAQKQTELAESQLLLRRQQAQLKLWQDRFLKARTQNYATLDTATEKLAFLSPYLTKDTDDVLQVWALERIDGLSATTAVQTESLAGTLVPLLAEYIHASNPRLRQLSVMSLENLGDHARPTAPEVLRQLQDESDTKTRITLLESLGTFAYRPALDEAILSLESDDELVVGQSVRTIGRICISLQPALEEPVFNTVAGELTKCYAQWKTSSIIHKELIQAIGKLAAIKSYLTTSVQLFDDILLAALTDPDAGVRSWAVRGVGELHQKHTLNYLLNEKSSLLNDSDPFVRIAVLESIQNYGGKKHLDPLWRRLASEDNSDAVKAIINAFVSIVNNTLNTQDTFHWVNQFENTQTELSVKDQQILYDQIVRILWGKINKDKAGDTPVPFEQEHTVLFRLIDIARRNGQFEEVLSGYDQLLNDRNASDAVRTRCQKDIIRLTIQNNMNRTLLPGAADALQQLMNRNQADHSLSEIAQYYDEFKAKELPQILQNAQGLTSLINPLKKYPSPEIREQWTIRMKAVAIALIEAQEKIIQESGKDNSEVIFLLGHLDRRLTDYPVNATTEIRLAWLKEKRLLVESPIQELQKEKDSAI